MQFPTKSRSSSYFGGSSCGAHCGTAALGYFILKGEGMERVKNISEAEDWFQVLQTSERTQTAVMTLEPGKASGPSPNQHPKSDQALLVIEGVVEAEIAGKKQTLQKGDAALVPAGTMHRFVNKSSSKVVTFNTYSPPAY